MNHRIAQPQPPALSSELQKLDAGNRFRMMFGMSLLPEDGVVPTMPNYQPNEKLWPVPTARK